MTGRKCRSKSLPPQIKSTFRTHDVEVSKPHANGFYILQTKVDHPHNIFSTCILPTCSTQPLSSIQSCESTDSGHHSCNCSLDHSIFIYPDTTSTSYASWHVKGKKKGKGKQKSDKQCENCKKSGHTKETCWAPGSDKEGQWLNLNQKKKSEEKGKEKKNESAAAAEAKEIFAFTCTSTFSSIAESLQIPISKCGSVINSDASSHFCPDCLKFVNYRPLEGQKIWTANGEAMMA